MRHTGWALFIAIDMLGVLPAAGAQSVRGLVSERTSGLAISGALVTLEPGDSVSGAAVSSTLTNERGLFFLRVPKPGRYRVRAKRIGVRRFDSEVIELDSSEVREMNITLEPFAFQLPSVRVVSNDICTTRPEQVTRLASLWDEARTALAAAQISLRDRLVRARIEHYVRILEPRSLKVEEERSMRRAPGAAERAFFSLSGDDLSKGGYWRSLGNDSVAYYAPDADVLLSAAFRRDHCYTLREGRRERAGLTGIAFSPVSGRKTADVEGTIWLDSRTFELRLVEFAYTSLPPATITRGIGGEVQFSRVETGAWIVSRWFIRMPRYGGRPIMRSSGIPGQPATPVYRVVNLVEEGGTVTPESGGRNPPS